GDSDRVRGDADGLFSDSDRLRRGSGEISRARKTPSASASLRTSNPRPNGARRTRFPYVGPLNHLAASGSAAVVEGLPWCARPKAWPRFEGLTGRTSVDPCDDSLPFYGSQ